MRATRTGKPEYIPITLTFDTEDELNAFLAILRETQRDKWLGREDSLKVFARQVESTLSAVIHK